MFWLWIVHIHSHFATDYPSAQLIPVAVHVVEVGAPVGGAARGVDLGVQVDAAGARVREAPVGLLPRQAGGAYAVPGQAVVVGERRDVGGDAGVQPRLAVPDVLGVHREPRTQLEAAGRGEVAQPV